MTAQHPAAGILSALAPVSQAPAASEPVLRDFVAELKTLAGMIFRYETDDKDAQEARFYVKQGDLRWPVANAFIETATGKVYTFRKPGVRLIALSAQIEFLVDQVSRKGDRDNMPVLMQFIRRDFPTLTEVRSAQTAAAERRTAQRTAQVKAEAAAKAERLAKAAAREAKRLDPHFGACHTLAPKAPKAEEGKGKKGKKR